MVLVLALVLTSLSVTRGQSDVFSARDLACLHNDGTVYHAPSIRCHPLLEQGPCPQGHWLVLQPSEDAFLSLEAKCMPCPCCKEPLKRIYWEADGTCRQSSDSSLCRPGNQLALDFDGTGVCRCKPGYAKIRGASDDCLALYRSYGKCSKGQYLVPAGEGWAHCARNTCPRENMARWTDGQCYQLDTQGPCPERKDLLRVDSDTGELNCVSQAFNLLTLFDNTPQRCRQPCILQITSSGGKPTLSPKLAAFLQRQRLHPPTTSTSAYGPQSENWAWGF